MHVLLILEAPGPCQSQSDKKEVYSTATRTPVDSFLIHSLHRRILNASRCFRQLFKMYITTVLRHDCSHDREHYYGFTIILNFIGGFNVVLTWQIRPCAILLLLIIRNYKIWNFLGSNDANFMVNLIETRPHIFELKRADRKTEILFCTCFRFWTLSTVLQWAAVQPSLCNIIVLSHRNTPCLFCKDFDWLQLFNVHGVTYTKNIHSQCVVEMLNFLTSKYVVHFVTTVLQRINQF
jgi:hypothetical protein